MRKVLTDLERYELETLIEMECYPKLELARMFDISVSLVQKLSRGKVELQRKTYKKLTAEEKQEIIEHIKSGKYTKQELAYKYGVSLPTIWTNTRGIKQRKSKYSPLTPEDKKEIRRLLKTGKYAREEVARLFNTKTSVVYNYTKDITDIKRINTLKLSKEDIKQIREHLLSLKYSRMELAKIYDVSFEAILYHSRDIKDVKNKIKKVCPKEIEKIVKLYKGGGHTHKSLGKMFNLHFRTISRYIKQFDAS